MVPKAYFLSCSVAFLDSAASTHGDKPVCEVEDTGTEVERNIIDVLSVTGRWLYYYSIHCRMAVPYQFFTSNLRTHLDDHEYSPEYFSKKQSVWVDLQFHWRSNSARVWLIQNTEGGAWRTWEKTMRQPSSERRGQREVSGSNTSIKQSFDQLTE